MWSEKWTSSSLARVEGICKEAVRHWYRKEGGTRLERTLTFRLKSLDWTETTLGILWKFLCRSWIWFELSLRKVDLKVAQRLNSRQGDPRSRIFGLLGWEIMEVPDLLFDVTGNGRRDGLQISLNLGCFYGECCCFFFFFNLAITFYNSLWNSLKLKLFWVKRFLINASYLVKWGINTPSSKMIPHSLVPSIRLCLSSGKWNTYIRTFSIWPYALQLFAILLSIPSL